MGLSDDFPLVLPANEDFSSYHGYLGVKGPDGRAHEYWIRVDGLPTPDLAPGATSLQSVTFQGDADLEALLHHTTADAVRARLRDSTDLATFLCELRELVAQTLRARPAPALPCATYYSQLVRELDELGWDAVQAVAPDLSSVTLQVCDSAQRVHSLTVMLPANYPKAAPTVVAQLPGELQAGAGPGTAAPERGPRTIAAIVSDFREAIESFQGLWLQLDDLDRHARVIEPEQPIPRGAVHRRVALGGHCSLWLKLSPLTPSAPPQCKFLGAESVIGPLREKLYQAFHSWRGDRLVRANIEEALGQELASKQAGADEEDMSADCAICYAYHLPIGDGEAVTPEYACNNASCGRPFHAPCLKEWLLADPGTRQSFDILFGACPYCSQSINLKLRD